MLTLSIDGIRCAAGGFTIDPKKPVAKAIITHAHGDHVVRGCDAYYASEPTACLLKRKLGRWAVVRSIPWGASQVFDEVRVSLHPAGHILGSAQVRIDGNDGIWVVSGDFKRQADPSCEPFEVVPCDVFVSEASFASPHYVWPDADGVADALAAWLALAPPGQLDAIFAYPLGKTQRVASMLAARGLEAAFMTPPAAQWLDCYQAAGVRLPTVEVVGGGLSGLCGRGGVAIVPPDRRTRRALRRAGVVRTAFVSGWIADGAGELAETGFVLSDHADWPALLSTAVETGASELRTVHGDGSRLRAAWAEARRA